MNLGMDIGSVFSKVVLLADDKTFEGLVVRSGRDYRATANALREEILQRRGVRPEGIASFVATGTGCATVTSARHVASDLVCTARGIAHLFPEARGVVEIGGQSAKAFHVGADGRLGQFTVSEKCASGSGRFVDTIARVLRVDLDEFSRLALRSEAPLILSTGCAVFGESEVITRIAEGAAPEAIAAGVNRSIAEKVAALARKIRLAAPCVVCGGGALNPGLVKELERQLRFPLLVPVRPQLVTALGAALA